jgi:fused signal recognition particle receptor
VRYIGIGEGIDQLRMFNRHDFVNALFGEQK